MSDNEISNDAHSKRLEKLRRGRKLSKLTYPDLILLLQEDEMLREILVKLLGGTPAKPARLAPPPPPPLPPDPLRAQLGEPVELLKKIQADAGLAQWLGSGKTENEGEKLLRFIAHAAQWEEILSLWDVLSERCKQEKRLATADEQRILENCLKISNLRWQERQAQLVTVPAGSRYEQREMVRLINSDNGETVHALALPGLKNPAGKVERAPLVKTSA